MDIGKSFGYVFEDEKWVTKVLIGGVLNLIPIVNLVNVGYALRTLRNVAAGAERPLPEWDDFGDYFVKGLLVAVGILIYAIPVLLVSVLSAIVGALAGGNSDVTSGLLGLCTAGLACIGSLYGLALALWLPAALVRYAMSGEFGAFFRFGEIWGFISRNLGAYIVALIVAWLASLVAGIVGGILCGVGVLFTSFWAMLVAAHLLGQLQRENEGPATPVMPAEPTPPTTPTPTV
jgi:hypothetical protein